MTMNETVEGKLMNVNVAIASAYITLRYSVLYYTLRDADSSTIGAFKLMEAFQPNRMPSLLVSRKIWMWIEVT